MSVIEAPAPIKTEVTTRDVLHRAADLLEEFGWCQNSYGNKTRGQFCAAGAVGEALAELGVHVEVPVRGLAPDGARGLHWLWETQRWWGDGEGTAWNDEPGRTKAEVVARLRAAAEATQDEGAGT